ncbi:hypothetical protein Hanom_Chr04g00295771 [Helianthus anomalus]
MFFGFGRCITITGSRTDPNCRFFNSVAIFEYRGSVLAGADAAGTEEAKEYETEGFEFEPPTATGHRFSTDGVPLPTCCCFVQSEFGGIFFSNCKVLIPGSVDVGPTVTADFV